MRARMLWLSVVLLCAGITQVQAARPYSDDVVADAAFKEADLRGSARVLVLLDSGTAPAPVGDNARAWANARVMTLQDRAESVLQSLPTQGYIVQRRYQALPLLALRADRATLQRLRTHPGVVRVDLDPPLRAAAAPADDAINLTRINTLLSVGLTGAGMKVAVIDSGVDTDHRDLRPALVDQACFCSALSGSQGCCPNRSNRQTGPGSAEDAHGHGTNVTGIIAGRGVMAPRGGMPEAQVVAVRILDAQGRTCCGSDMLAAMDWLSVNHPDVDAVNISVVTDTRYFSHCDNAEAFTQGVKAAVSRLEAQGAMVVAAAGNAAASQQMSAPACVSNVMSVGATWAHTYGSVTFENCTDATTAPMKLACFSNRSETTDIFAPGAYVEGPSIDGGSSQWIGTSQATPVVTACALALKQAAPASTVAQRAEVMTLSPTQVNDPVSGRRYPFLDCRKAAGLLAPQWFGPVRLNGQQPLLPGSASDALPQASPAHVSPRGVVAPRARYRMRSPDGQ